MKWKQESKRWKLPLETTEEEEDEEEENVTVSLAVAKDFSMSATVAVVFQSCTAFWA